MQYGLAAWLAGLILLLPAIVLGFAWAKRRAYYERNPALDWRRKLYSLALISASLSVLAYLGYWSWRILGLDQFRFPLSALLFLDRFVFYSVLLPPMAIISAYSVRDRTAFQFYCPRSG